ncbi:PREDICTED: uncharacterized protein LOC106810941 [Priapulus caudatus]|uniref:Uncharacterized protein LOC106810941 n=1 Tax=Priapulus caudatus TaxID=37621 RepID=A0ABM1ECJ1_PRICU|nr:PREDICTED: uncharacterized protein LOC106810941 [Priapulus caudatus]
MEMVTVARSLVMLSICLLSPASTEFVPIQKTCYECQYTDIPNFNMSEYLIENGVANFGKIYGSSGPSVAPNAPSTTKCADHDEAQLSGNLAVPCIGGCMKYKGMREDQTFIMRLCFNNTLFSVAKSKCQDSDTYDKKKITMCLCNEPNCNTASTWSYSPFLLLLTVALLVVNTVKP